MDYMGTYMERMRCCRCELALQGCFHFCFNDPATTEIYTLSLHDALPISFAADGLSARIRLNCLNPAGACRAKDRKSTRLNSSHVSISYAVFCLKKKIAPKISRLLHRQHRRRSSRERGMRTFRRSPARPAR